MYETMLKEGEGSYQESFCFAQFKNAVRSLEEKCVAVKIQSEDRGSWWCRQGAEDEDADAGDDLGDFKICSWEHQMRMGTGAGANNVDSAMKERRGFSSVCLSQA